MDPLQRPLGWTPMAFQRFYLLRADQRKHARKTKHYIVRIRTGDGSPLVRGILSDLSERGARLSLSAETHIPLKFTMIFPSSGARQCRLVWRSGREIGVQFVSG